ncbi:hypothetical protein [Aquimarina sp. 2201CG14-23]|uniref:hypothetical protein n=1 Tax=Aquimarina mycalae TaxID=3040073 RepID=UPI0024781C33|nr:hypothetical protein [Aquimarina sp. 2201CG14-23]MDH7444727.1 hypothetical protein [Aquimarina sp. 2201CG14-23]
MGNRLCYAFVVMIGFVFFMISCQKEERQLIDPNIDTTIPKDSQLADLMRSIVIHDGSYDDVVDGGNCYSINLPYSIIRNSTEEIEINQISDYNQLNTSDNIQIQFPITITKSDHTEEIVEDLNALQSLAIGCDMDDPDIECIDFVYPLRFLTFNFDINVFETTEVIHDAEVFVFMENLEESTVVSIDFPIRLLLHNGESVEATHNDELLSRIISFANSCDENDG